MVERRATIPARIATGHEVEIRYYPGSKKVYLSNRGEPPSAHWGVDVDKLLQTIDRLRNGCPECGCKGGCD